MTTLCRFCRGEDGPNEATQMVLTPAGDATLPVCDACLVELEEQAYNDWLAGHGPDEDMSDPAYNSHPAAMGRIP